MRTKPDKIDLIEELRKAKFDSRNYYDLAIGCLNRICVTDNEDEINRMVCGLVHDIEIISQANRKRIRIKSLIEKEGENNDNETNN